MFGNILNNSQIISLVKDKKITIYPFNESKLKLSHYPLTPGGVLTPGKKNAAGKWQHSPKHDFAHTGKSECVFKPNEYAIIEVEEDIHLPEGIVGNFVPSSNLIEQGFGLTAGKIDPLYGNIGGKRQKILFGLKNLREEENALTEGQHIAHIYFVDLRGLNNAPQVLTDYEVHRFMERFSRFKKADDDGPDYGSGA